MVDLASPLRIFPLVHGGVFVERPRFPRCAKGVRPSVEIAVHVEADSERHWRLPRCASVYHSWGETAHSGAPASWFSLCFVTRSFAYNRLWAGNEAVASIL